MPKVDHLIPHGKRWDCTKRCAPYHAMWYARRTDNYPPIPPDVRPQKQPTFQQGRVTGSMSVADHVGAYIMLVGDIVSGFEAYGPFADGDSAIAWKQRKGNRELTQGQWYLMPLKGVNKP